jgi:hypothetical protein
MIEEEEETEEAMALKEERDMALMEKKIKEEEEQVLSHTLSILSLSPVDTRSVFVARCLFVVGS